MDQCSKASSPDGGLREVIKTLRERRPGLLKNPLQQMYIKEIYDNGLYKVLRDSRDPFANWKQRFPSAGSRMNALSLREGSTADDRELDGGVRTRELEW